MSVALIAGAALGGVLSETGHLETLAALYGLEGQVSAWAIVFPHSLLASALFVAVVSRLARRQNAPLPIVGIPRSPFLGACAGVAYGVCLWLVVVAYGVPAVAPFVAGVTVSSPYHHVESFLALAWFGAVLGAWYPLLRSFFDRLRSPIA